MKNKSWLLSAAFLLLFSGCIGSEPENTTDVPEKNIAVSEEGVVTEKEITIFEDGTHFFTAVTGEKYLLKSSLIDLSRYEDENVHIIGERPETFPEGEMPVITVFSVETIMEDSNMRESLFTESDHFFAASFPGNWQRSITPDGILQYGLEKKKASITVRIIDTESEEAEALIESMAEWSQVNVGGKPGSQNTKSGGDILIVVPLPEQESLAVFEFSSRQNQNLEKVTFYKMLTGLEWIESQEPSEEDEALLDKDIVYCGGIAKKLCPSGYRCELRSFEENAVGVCVDSSMPPQDISGFLMEAEEQIADQSETPALQENFDKEEEQEWTARIPEGWTEYRRDRLSYSFAIPRSWWWEEKGGSEYVSRIVIATEEITDTNQIISLEILPEPIDKRVEKEASSEFTISIPRDSSSSFFIHGEKSYTQQIQDIASSLSLF